MEKQQINEQLKRFLDSSPNAWYAVANMARELEAAGFARLEESDAWELEGGRGYYVTRNGSALIAFRLPKRGLPVGYNIMASHADSPAFRVKTNPEIFDQNGIVKLNVEGYGGMLRATWFDRPLTVAGRAVVRIGSGVETRLVYVDRDLGIIPSLAIHMDRQANDGATYNIQNDMLPIIGNKSNGYAEGDFMKLVAEAAGVDADDILDCDLMLCTRDRAVNLGVNGELIASGRLDDLQCAYASLCGIIEAQPADSCAVHCVFDNEEVGSGTKQGAASTFLRDTLTRVNSALGGGDEDHARAVSSGFMVSADNAHAVHPNHAEKADPTNRPAINGGIVIKYSANQRYTTDAVSGAIFRTLCARADVPTQTFHNRSDMAGGSTLGNISTSQVALNCVDVGLPQLAMHSAYETAGTDDVAYLAAAARALFSSTIRRTADGSFTVE